VTDAERDQDPWFRFVYAWGQICQAMDYQAAYRRHLAEAAPGTPLAAAMGRCMHSVGNDASIEDMIAFIKWELWECIMSLDPWVPRDRGLRPGEVLPDWRHRIAGKDLPRVQDGFHASCCASRAEGVLERLRRKLAEQ